MVYFNKEAFDELLWWLEIPALLTFAESDPDGTAAFARVKQRLAATSKEAAEAGYEVGRYLSKVAAGSEPAGEGGRRGSPKVRGAANAVREIVSRKTAEASKPAVGQARKKAVGPEPADAEPPVTVDAVSAGAKAKGTKAVARKKPVPPGRS